MLADDQPSEFSSAGKTEISEIGYNSNSVVSARIAPATRIAVVASATKIAAVANAARVAVVASATRVAATMTAVVASAARIAAAKTIAAASRNTIGWAGWKQPIWKLWNTVPSLGNAIRARIWLGVEGMDGWGTRVRYWQMSASQFIFNNNSSTLAADDLSNLDLFTIDAEVTKRGEFGPWKWLGFFGGRYAADRQLELFDNFYESAPLSIYIAEKFQYAVGGVTTGLELSRPIGWGGWKYLALSRVSPMWGNGSDSEIDRQLGGSTPSVSFDSHHAGIDMTIWEVQLACNALSISRAAKVHCLPVADSNFKAGVLRRRATLL